MKFNADRASGCCSKEILAGIVVFLFLQRKALQFEFASDGIQPEIAEARLAIKQVNILNLFLCLKCKCTLFSIMTLSMDMTLLVF